MGRKDQKTHFESCAIDLFHGSLAALYGRYIVLRGCSGFTPEEILKKYKENNAFCHIYGLISH